MAGNTFSVRASFDGTELVQGFQDVKTELNGLKTAGDNAGKSLGQMLQQKNSTSNYSRQLGQIKQQLTDLSVNYSRLSDAEKNSEFGVAMANKIEELKIKALELKGVMDDVNSSLSSKGGAIDMGPMDFGQQWSELQRNAEQTHAKFESVRKISSGVASGFAAIQGAAALLGGENENLEKTLVKVQGAMAVAQGIGGIWDLVEGIMQASLAYGLDTAASVANTAASAANTTAKTANTTASAANTAASATNTTAKVANTGANAANTAASAANTAASTANTTAKAANTTASVTNTAASAANTAASTANTTAKAANTTASVTNTAASAANTTAKTANTTASAANTTVAIADTAAKGANTTATTANTVATAAATVAQKAFNAAAKANPYVLLASVILAVGAALVGFVNKTKEAKNAQEDFNNEITKLANQSSAEKIIRVKELSLAYASLGDNLNAKKQFVTDYKDELANMGIEMNNVNDADRVFVQQTGAYISALQSRAKADATRQFASKKYNEYLEKISEKEQQLQNVFNIIRDSSQNVWGGMLSMDQLDTMSWDAISREYSVLPAIAKGFKSFRSEIKSLKQEANTVVDDILADAIALDNKANALLKNNKKPSGGGRTSGGGTTTKEEDIFTADSLMAAQQEVQKLQDKLNRMSPNDAAFETTKKQLIEAQARVKELQDKMKAPDVIINPESLKGLQQEVTTLQNKLNEMSPDDAAFDTTLQQLNEAKAKVKELQDKMREPVTPLTKTEQLVKAYEDAGRQISDIAKQYEIGIIDVETAKKQIDEINAELQKLGLNPIKITLTPSIDGGTGGKTSQWDGFFGKDRDTRAAIDDAVKAFNLGLVNKDYAQAIIDAINIERVNAGLPPVIINLDIEKLKHVIDTALQMFDAFSSIGSAVSSINSVYEAFKNLPDALDEAENGWERFMVGFETGMTILNAITSILGMINTLLTTFNTIQEISTALKMKDTIAAGAQASADTTAAGATMTKAGANMAEAATGAGKSVSWLPIVGPILAVAAIGAIMGVMMGVMSKSKFATGGIVPGNRIGDMDLVRVNGGEMILNNRQQSNLFRMIDQNRFQTPDLNPKTVNFRIQGDTLVGVIENYNRKKSRS